MADISQVKQQITQAKQKVAEQRELIKQRQEEAKRKRDLLEQAQRKLPSNTSQRALRSKMSGLQGRAKRREIQKVKKNILSGKQEIGTYEGQLITAGNELTKYEEEQIKPVEAEVKRVEEYNAAVRTIEKAAAKGMVWTHAIYGEGLVQDLAQDYEKQRSLSRLSLQKEVKSFEQANPTEKLNVDWKNLQITGVKSGTLGETLSIKDYNKKIGKIQNKSLEVPEANLNIQNISADTLSPITSQSKVKQNIFQKIGGAITGLGIKTVSAKDLNNNVTYLGNDTNVSSGLSSGINTGINKIQSIGNNLIGTPSDISKAIKEADKKAKTISTGKVISAATGKESFTIRPYTENKLYEPSLTPQFGTIQTQFGGYTNSGNTIEVVTPLKTYGSIQAERNIQGLPPVRGLYEQKAPESTINKVISYTPVIGQVKPIVESGRKLSSEYSAIRSSEALLGAGQVSQKKFLKSTAGFGLQVGLIGADIAFAESIAKQGVRSIAKNIPREKFAGLTQKQYSRFLESTGEDIGRLNKAEVRWISVEKRPSGRVSLKGFQTEGGLSREINFEGKILKTESGKKILTGGGKYKTEGLKLFSVKEGEIPKTFSFSQVGLFESGSKGASVYRGKIGNLELFKEVGIGGTKDIVSTSFITPLKKASKRKLLRIASKQSKQNIIRGGQEIIDVSTKDVVKLNKNLFFTSGKNEQGLSIILENKGKKSIGGKVLGGKKTPLSKTFQETKVIETLRNPPAPKPLIAKVEKDTTKIGTSLFPSVAASPYYGTGMYEQTETQTMSPILMDTQTQQSKVDSNFSNRTNIKPSSNLIIGQAPGQRERQRTKEITKEVSRLNQAPKSKQTQEQVPRQRNLLREAMRTAQESKQRTKQTTQTEIEKTKVKSKTPVPKVVFDLFKKSKEKKGTEKTDEELFSIFGRRYGQFREIGKAKTEKEAAKLSRTFSLGGLGASTFIEKGGRKIDVSLGTGFRKSKQDRFVQVQRKEKRLGTFGERREIKKSRKNKGRIF